LKQGIHCRVVFPEKVYDFCQYRFADEHRRVHSFHERDCPLVIWIVAIEVSKKGTGVTDRDHGRRNLLRAFVAGTRPPARLPARSALIA